MYYEIYMRISDTKFVRISMLTKTPAEETAYTAAELNRPLPRSRKLLQQLQIAPGGCTEKTRNAQLKWMRRNEPEIIWGAADA